MKSKARTFIYVLMFFSVHQYCIAQQKGVDDLVGQYQKLLHPPADEARNSLAYTQHYLDLRKKIASLGQDSRAAFEQGISKFASDSGYTTLHNMLFAEDASQSTADTTQNKSASKSMNGNAAVPNPATIDSTVQMQVFDKKHKVLQTIQIKPADLETKMKKDGFQIAVASYDFTSHSVTLTLIRTDASGTTARITLPSTGDVDAKYNLQSGNSLSLHSVAGGTSTVQVSAVKKTSTQHTQKKK